MNPHIRLLTKAIFRKKKARDLMLLDFKLYYRARVIKGVCWHKKTHRSIKQERPRNKPTWCCRNWTGYMHKNETRPLFCNVHKN